MDTFENACPPQEQLELVEALCWECGRMRLCYEHLVCCTGSQIHTCAECRTVIQARGFAAASG
jgi:hypothetical protein